MQKILEVRMLIQNWNSGWSVTKAVNDLSFITRSITCNFAQNHTI